MTFLQTLLCVFVVHTSAVKTTKKNLPGLESIGDQMHHGPDNLLTTPYGLYPYNNSYPLEKKWSGIYDAVHSNLNKQGNLNGFQDVADKSYDLRNTRLYIFIFTQQNFR